MLYHVYYNPDEFFLNVQLLEIKIVLYLRIHIKNFVMRKILFLYGLLSIITLQLKADGSDLFDVNEDQIQAEMNDLILLEQFILQNDGVTYHQLQIDNSDLITNITPDHSAVSSALGIHSPMSDVTGFLWGLCLGPFGVLIAWLIDEDDLMMSVIGCLVSSAIGGG